MKAALITFITLFIHAAVCHAQQAPTATFEQQRAASSQAVMVKYPEAANPHSRLSALAQALVIDWETKQDWRLATPAAPMYLWDAAALQLRNEQEAAARQARQAEIAAQYQAQTAEVQRTLAERLAQIRATNYVTPAPTAPVQPQTVDRQPRTISTTVISGTGGVYTTHGGAAGGATIIQTVPGHFEIRQKGQPTQRVIITTP